MTKKKDEKLKDQGSLINSADKKIRKRSTKNKKKRSKMDVRSASVEDPPSMMMPVPITPFVEDPPSMTMPVLVVTPSVKDLSVHDDACSSHHTGCCWDNLY